MVDRKHREEIELLAGIGSVFEGPNKVCEVRYRIRVLQEKIESRTGIIDGLKDIRGIVNPIGVPIFNLFGKTLILVFKDGRQMDFLVGNARTGAIIGTSEIRSA